MKHVGFTGTRKGMTEKQATMLTRFLIRSRATHFHHGGCHGADLEAAAIAEGLHLEVVEHLPEKQEAKYLLARDRDIVDSVVQMFATPHNFMDIPRGSGTWYTIRYAGRQGCPLTIIYPDGVATHSNYDDL